jgi:hypothetical protein
MMKLSHGMGHFVHMGILSDQIIAARRNPAEPGS